MQEKIRLMELEVKHFLRLYWLKELEKMDVSSFTEDDQKMFREFVTRIDQAMNIFGGNHEIGIRH